MEKIYYPANIKSLIIKLSKDIEKFDNTEVWAYWIIMENGQDVYFDYCFVNDPDYQSIKSYDKKVVQKSSVFLRKKMFAINLLDIFMKERTYLP